MTQSLEKTVADIIYEADWQIEGRITDYERDITEFRMIDEEETVKAVIEAIRLFDTTVRET